MTIKLALGNYLGKISIIRYAQTNIVPQYTLTSVFPQIPQDLEFCCLPSDCHLPYEIIISKDTIRQFRPLKQSPNVSLQALCNVLQLRELEIIYVGMLSELKNAIYILLLVYS